MLQCSVNNFLLKFIENLLLQDINPSHQTLHKKQTNLTTILNLLILIDFYLLWAHFLF